MDGKDAHPSRILCEGVLAVATGKAIGTAADFQQRILDISVEPKTTQVVCLGGSGHFVVVELVHMRPNTEGIVIGCITNSTRGIIAA